MIKRSNDQTIKHSSSDVGNDRIRFLNLHLKSLSIGPIVMAILPCTLWHRGVFYEEHPIFKCILSRLISVKSRPERMTWMTFLCVCTVWCWVYKIQCCRFMPLRWVKLLLQKGADPNIVSTRGFTPLTLALTSFCLPIAKELVLWPGSLSLLILVHKSNQIPLWWIFNSCLSCE